MSRELAIATGIVLAVGLAVHAGDEKKPEAKAVCPGLEALCPVSGEPIDKDVSTKDAHGGTVYFCCAKCMGKFKADPAKYGEKVCAQQVAMAKERVQVACPVSGKPVKKSASADCNGTTIYFCCGMCPAAYTKDPSKFASKMASCFTLQTKCPVEGEPIDPAVFTKAKDGHNVYFCCAKCIAKFNADPDKYMKKLSDAAAGASK